MYTYIHTYKYIYLYIYCDTLAFRALSARPLPPSPCRVLLSSWDIVAYCLIMSCTVHFDLQEALECSCANERIGAILVYGFRGYSRCPVASFSLSLIGYG